MENSHNLKELFTKYLNKNISQDEYDELLGYFGRKDSEGELDELIAQVLAEDIPLKDNAELNKIGDSVQYKLRQKLQPQKQLKLRRFIPYAAIIIATLLGGLYLLFNYQKRKTKEDYIADVQPGHSAATLTLADGRKILLNDASVGSIAKEGSIDISKNTKGEVVYGTGSDAGSHNINTLSTANGETYQIVLSDGSKVWLNAATTLQYAADLSTQGKRKVKLLTGEAYFEVAKDKQHPFIVETAKQEVEVLGTHFNINSYADEGRTVTTLEEGSVKVSTSQGSTVNPVILRPEQQSLLVNGNIRVRDADLQSALAWKEGKMYFKAAPLDEVLRQVSRWYNITVEYQGERSKETFTGGIKRTSNLSAVLRILELSNIKYRLTKNNNKTTLIVQ